VNAGELDQTGTVARSEGACWTSELSKLGFQCEWYGWYSSQKSRLTAGPSTTLRSGRDDKFVAEFGVTILWWVGSGKTSVCENSRMPDELAKLQPGEDYYYDGPYVVFTAQYHLKRGNLL
jgi:hypothetical protein